MTPEEARQLDAVDSLAFARERLRLPDGIIYLDGNSLGALPKAAPAVLAETAERQWGDDLIASWNKHGWIDWSTRIAAKLAPIVGAKPSELLIADSTSVCLFKLLAAAAKARPDRKTILTQKRNFPTDLYVAQGLADMLGLRVKAVDPDEVIGAIDSDTAVVTLTHVDYRSAAFYDIRGINEAAHAAGALTVWDLSHSAGAVELDLDGSGCDLAVGCGYKYLNGGPGAPAFLYVAEHLQERLVPYLRGWMGHAQPFAFLDDYAPAPGITRFLAGTPPMLSLLALESGVESFDGLAMDAVWEKSVALFNLFAALIEERCGGHGLECITPATAELRGSHISYRHPHAFELCQALIAAEVIGDFRAPDVVRFGLTPLYLGYEDVWQAVDRFAAILESGSWRDPRFAVRGRVT